MCQKRPRMCQKGPRICQKRPEEMFDNCNPDNFSPSSREFTNAFRSRKYQERRSRTLRRRIHVILRGRYMSYEEEHTCHMSAGRAPYINILTNQIHISTNQMIRYDQSDERMGYHTTQDTQHKTHK